MTCLHYDHLLYMVCVFIFLSQDSNKNKGSTEEIWALFKETYEKLF